MTRSLAAAVLVCLAACGDGPTVVLVHVNGRPAMRAFDTLDVTVSNAGGSATQSFSLGAGRTLPLSFTVTPSGRTGDLDVSVVARDAAGNQTRGHGHGTATIVTGSTVDLDLTVDPDDFVVNEETARTQWLSFNEDQQGRQLGVAPDGTFLFTWENDCPLNRCDLLGRRFGADTTPASNATTMTTGDFIVNQVSKYTESPAIAVGQNAYMVAWLSLADDLATQKDVAATLVGFDGGHPRPTEITVSLDPQPESAPTVIARSDGTFAIVWQRTRAAPAVGEELRGAIFDATGGPLFGEFAVSAATTGDDTVPHGIALAAGAFVVVWTHTEGGVTNVRARVFSASGAPATANDIQVTSYTAGTAYGARVTPSGDGYLIGWQIFSGASPTLTAAPLIVRKFSGNGNSASTEITVAAQTVNLRAQPVMATRQDGAIGIAWQDCGARGDATDSCGIRFRLLHPSGMPAGDDLIVNTTTAGDQLAPSIAALGGDAFVVGWTDNSHLPPDTDGSGVRARVIYPSLDVHDGTLGARCGGAGDDDCDTGLTCQNAPGGGGKLCHEACTTTCKVGGVCVNGTFCAFQ
jgi:hypothetical protein